MVTASCTFEQVRLNGQEEARVVPAAAFAPISASALPFALWPSPQLTGLSPACGPVEGGLPARAK